MAESKCVRLCIVTKTGLDIRTIPPKKIMIMPVICASLEFPSIIIRSNSYHVLNRSQKLEHFKAIPKFLENNIIIDEFCCIETCLGNTDMQQLPSSIQADLWNDISASKLAGNSSMGRLGNSGSRSSNDSNNSEKIERVNEPTLYTENYSTNEPQIVQNP